MKANLSKHSMKSMGYVKWAEALVMDVVGVKTGGSRVGGPELCV